ncbi:MAG TPA: BsuPI-related putative proteinase inhibitor [Candidatus Ozemobacteraceae bacterium]|jgi:hypothetical protein
MAGEFRLVYDRGMRRLLPLVLLALSLGLLPASPADAWRKWEYVQPHELEITIRPEAAEIVAGEVATFTIRVRNRTDKTVDLPFGTGQRWDMVAFHENTQIWRWSNMLRWEEAPHTIPIRADRPETAELSWRTVDRHGMPLPQGIYRVQGMVMCSPRALVTNEAAIRLLPPVERKQDALKVKIGSFFEVQVPHLIDKQTVAWQIEYEYNDNRIDPVERRCDDVNETIVFVAKRVGHVTVHLYAHPEFALVDRSLERRTFRVDVVEHD